VEALNSTKQLPSEVSEEPTRKYAKVRFTVPYLTYLAVKTALAPDPEAGVTFKGLVGGAASDRNTKYPVSVAFVRMARAETVTGAMNPRWNVIGRETMSAFPSTLVDTPSTTGSQNDILI
jgi:hypothetical protein